MEKERHNIDYQNHLINPPEMPHKAGEVQKAINIDPAYYKRILEEQKRLGPTGGMEIGGTQKLAKIWRFFLMSVALLAVASLFAFLFYYFTNNLRVALIVVTLMLIYMVISAYLAEGNLDNRR